MNTYVIDSNFSLGRGPTAHALALNGDCLILVDYTYVIDSNFSLGRGPTEHALALNGDWLIDEHLRH